MQRPSLVSSALLPPYPIPHPPLTANSSTPPPSPPAPPSRPPPLPSLLPLSPPPAVVPSASAPPNPDPATRAPGGPASRAGCRRPRAGPAPRRPRPPGSAAGAAAPRARLRRAAWSCRSPRAGRRGARCAGGCACAPSLWPGRGKREACRGIEVGGYHSDCINWTV